MPDQQGELKAFGRSPDPDQGWNWFVVSLFVQRDDFRPGNMTGDLTDYTIFHDADGVVKHRWILKRDGAKRALKRFATKAEAIDHAAARFGADSPATVKIQKLDGTFEEERTYPGSMDPRASKG
jgi:hypothetical protein